MSDSSVYCVNIYGKLVECWKTADQMRAGLGYGLVTVDISVIGSFVRESFVIHGSDLLLYW